MPGDDPPPPGSSLEGKMTSIIKRLRSIRDSFRDTLTPENAETLRPTYNRLSTLQDRLDEYGDQAVELNSTIEIQQHLINVDGLLQEGDRLVREAQMHFLAKTEKSTSASMNRSSNSGAPLRLPKLELPVFNGEAEEWRSWYNVFRLAVHRNENLNAVEKFSYLLKYTKGEPHSMIKELDLTEGNYTVAWGLVVKRYQSDRRHIFLHYNGLLDLPEAKKGKQISVLLHKIREHTQALEAVGHPPSAYDGILVASVMRKLSDNLASRFEDYRRDTRDPNVTISSIHTEYPKVQELLDFLERESVAFEERPSARASKTETKVETKALVSVPSSSAPSTTHEEKAKPHNKNEQASHRLPPEDPPKQQSKPSKKSQEPRLQKCPECSESHRLTWCPAFKRKSPADRQRFAREKGLCNNCLSKHDPGTPRCPSDNTCWVCQQRHNTLLHGAEEKSSEPSSKIMVSQGPSSTVLLATVQVRIKTKGGSHIVRGILDSAAQGTFLTYECAKRVGLKLISGPDEVSGISGSVVQTYGYGHATVFGLGQRTISKNHRMVVVDRITNPTPSTAIAQAVRQRVQGWTLADPSFDAVGPVDILIGADLFPYIVQGAPVPLGPGLPVAIETTLGYVLMGPTPTFGPNPKVLLSCLSTKDQTPTPSPTTQQLQQPATRLTALLKRLGSFLISLGLLYLAPMPAPPRPAATTPTRPTPITVPAPPAPVAASDPSLQGSTSGATIRSGWLSKKAKKAAQRSLKRAIEHDHKKSF
ncbi:uncharacterized protein [Bemisia tabaci]|uniref:uncharacterized protein n=1 Tax=Bemisia tabaci TaxID=7038 RepID=UPI003B280E74